jgi:hypothetical protein
MKRPSDPRERSLRARVAAYSLHARYDPRQTTAKARATFSSSFERLVDPDGKLPLAERLRRAEAARRAHYARLARLSHITRRSRRRASEAKD